MAKKDKSSRAKVREVLKTAGRAHLKRRWADSVGRYGDNELPSDVFADISCDVADAVVELHNLLDPVDAVGRSLPIEEALGWAYNAGFADARRVLLAAAKDCYPIPPITLYTFEDILKAYEGRDET